MRSRKAIYLLTAALLTVLTQKPLPAQSPASSGTSPIIILPNPHPELALPCPVAPPPADTGLVVIWGPEVTLTDFSAMNTYLPRLTTSGDAVHVVWGVESSSDKAVIRSSFDRGQAWNHIERIGPRGTAYGMKPVIAAWGSILYVTYYLHQLPIPFFWGASLQASRNSGHTWSDPPQNLLPGGLHPAVSVWEHFVNVVVPSNNIISHRLSSNGGVSFLSQDTLAHLPGGPQPTRMKAYQNYVFLAYPSTWDSTWQFDIFFQRSIDYGRNFEPPIMLSTPDWYHSQLPSLDFTEHGDLYVAWMDYKYTTSAWGGDILMRHSSDFGEHWDEEIQVTFNHFAVTNAIATQDSQVHVIWEDCRFGSSSTESELYYINSENFGLSWSNEERLTYAHGLSMQPDMCQKNDTLHLVWSDLRGNIAYIYYKQGIVSRCSRTQLLAQSPGYFDLPSERILTIYPNPFNTFSTLNLILSRQSNVNLVIINLMGTRVTTLGQGLLKAGSYWYTWEGHDNQGKLVSSGVYLVLLEINNRIETCQKLLYLK